MASICRQISDVNYFVLESIGNAHTFLKEGVRNSRNNEVSNFKFYTHVNKVYKLKVPKYKVSNSSQSLNMKFFREQRGNLHPPPQFK